MFNIINSGNAVNTLTGLPLGDSPLLLTSEGFTRRGVVADFQNGLTNHALTIVDEIKPNPELATLAALLDRFTSQSFTSLIALGGGSVMDAAKVLSRLLGYPGKMLYNVMVENEDLPEKQPLPLITIPTSAGTGAEVTPFATVWDRHSQTKFSFVDRIPDYTILDATLSQTLPRDETLYSGLDALSHALESLWNHNRTKTSKRAALAAIDLLVANLSEALAKPANLVVRANLLQGANLAGQAIAETRTALAHAMSYSITLKYGMPHGLACSFTLPVLLQQFSNAELGLSPHQRQQILSLLTSLNLPAEVAQYATAEQIFADYDYELDPSRAKNFTAPVSPQVIKAVLQESLYGEAQYAG